VLVVVTVVGEGERSRGVRGEDMVGVGVKRPLCFSRGVKGVDKFF